MKEPMKEWELKLIKERAANNRFVVNSDEGLFLCLKINDEFIIKYSNGRKITNIISVTKL